MMIDAEDQMTGNWLQIPDCVIISPSTTARSSARGKDGEMLGRKGGKKQMSEDLPSTNKAPPNNSVFFWLSRRVPGYQFNLPWVFFKWYHCSILIVVALFVRAS